MLDNTKLKVKIKQQKLFLNMVVHDLRNPSDSIFHGLTRANEQINEQLDKIMKDTQNFFKTNMPCQKLSLGNSNHS